MILYYGSETDFKEPQFGYGKLSNDYGLGFYLTPSYEMAKLWAGKNQRGGYVLTFDFDFNDLKVLKLGDFGEDKVLKWISILTKHRFDFALRERFDKTISWLNKKFPVNLDGYDMVVGYRADDSYFHYSSSFVANELSLETLEKAMKIGKLGIQYVAISKKAYGRCRFLKSERIEHTDEYAAFQKKALEEFHSLRSEESITNTFIRDLQRKYGD